MNLLLVSEDPALRESLKSQLKTMLGVKLRELSSFADAVVLLDSQERIDLVVAGYTEPPRAEQPVHKALWAGAGLIPGILVGPKPAKSTLTGLSRNPVGLLDRDDTEAMKELVRLVRELVDQGKLKREASDQGFVRINTGLLISVSPLQADVYIRLNERKFVKLFQAGDEINHKDLEKYRYGKGVEYLFMRDDEAFHFVKKLEQELQQRLEATKQGEGNFKQLGQVHETIRELIQQLGPSEEVQNVVMVSVKLTLKSMRTDWKLSQLMKQLKTEGGYIAEHSMLLAYIAGLIAARTEWAGESTMAKLTYAALLHDITLKKQELAELESVADFERKKAKFTKQDFQEFRFHPVWAADACRQFKNVPFDVESIIIQHHERPDGSGFPRGLRHVNIHPLSAILIVAHELIYCMRKIGNEFRMDDFTASMSHYYKGDFEKILKVLRPDD